MKRLLHVLPGNTCRFLLLKFLMALFLVNVSTAHAANETFSTGSFIINMGATNPNTVANGLKPYGLVYDLIRNYNVPVKWVIGQGKLKDGADFTYNGIQYKGGTFIIPAEYRTAAVNARITFWQGQGVVGTTTTSSLTVDVFSTLKAVPRWTLDAANGSIAQGYLTNAGITLAAFPNAYNWKAPGSLDCCDDFFVMPHADPVWATHGRLWSWNKDCLGSVWAACHAVSALENMVNPSNRSQQTNFLTQKDPAFTGTSGNYANSNSLLLWGVHDNGSIPYTHRLFDHPVMQYLGTTDAAQLNGSEQIYIPRQGATTARWNPGATIGVYDPTQADVPSLNPDLSNAAALLVFGRGFDDTTRGYVMYEAGHSHNRGSTADVAAQRAFLNFSFYQILPKAPSLSVSGLSDNQTIQGGVGLPLSISATSPLLGITFTYQWSSTCGGSFSSTTSPNPTFTPPVVGVNTPCVVTCIVSDQCGRQSFISIPVVITPGPRNPVAGDDAGTISSGCGTSGSNNITISVLDNDTDADNDPLTVTALINTNNGTWSSNGTTVTYTSAFGFAGSATAQYIVCDNTSRCDTALITVSVGSLDSNGCFPGTVYDIASVDTATAQTNNSVTNPTAAFSQDYDDADPLTYAALNNATDSLVLDFGSIISFSTAKKILVAAASGNATSVTGTMYSKTIIGGARTLIGTITNTDVTTPTETEYTFPAAGMRYLVIYRTAGTADLRVDAMVINNYGCVSAALTANRDDITTPEDIPQVIDVTSNDINPGDLALTLTVTQNPTIGKVSVNTDTTITYVNNTDVSGTDSFTYQICNTQGLCSTAKVYITITDDGCTAGNYRPLDFSSPVTATFSGTTLTEDGYIKEDGGADDNFGTNNTADIGKKITKRRRFVIKIPNNTTANSFRGQIPSNAVLTAASLRLTVTGGDNSTLSLSTYRMTGNPNWDEGTFTWTIRRTGTNWTSPGGDFNSTPLSSATLTRPGTADNGDQVTFDIMSAVSAWHADTTVNRGIMVGQTVSGTQVDKRFTFGTSENGTASNRPLFSITYVLPLPCTAITNRSPLANPDTITTPGNAAATIGVLANDADPDAGNTISLSSIIGPVTGGSAVVSGNNVIFTPNGTFNGISTFKYRMVDNSGLADTAYITVFVTNVAPLAVKDTMTLVSGTSAGIAVKSNDNDFDGPASGAPTITVNANNGLSVVSGNSINYTPNAGFTGNDTIVYQVCESASSGCNAPILCDTALVVLRVLNQSPVAVKDTASTNQCQVRNISILLNDNDPENGALTVTITGQPTNGTATMADDILVYTPDIGFAGPAYDTIIYNLCDNGTPSLCDTAMVVVFIHPLPAVNTKPVAFNDTTDVVINNTAYWDILTNDDDPDNDALIPSVPGGILAPSNGTVSVLPNGLLEYIPDFGFTGNDSMDYVVCDDVAVDQSCPPISTKCDTARFYVFILSPDINSSPTADRDIYSVNEDTTVDLDVLANDSFGINGPGTLDISITDNANHGTAVVNDGGTPNDPSDDMITYTPNANYTGQDTLIYEICDLDGDCDTAIVFITVNAVDDFPLAEADTANVNEDASVIVDVLNNDTFGGDGPSGSAITVTANAVNGNAVVDNNGTPGDPTDDQITYTPGANFNGTDSFIYQICDLDGDCDTAIVRITVDPVDDVPLAEADFVNVNEDGSITGATVAANDILSGDGGNVFNIGCSLCISTGNGTLNFNNNGTYDYTPDPDYHGPDYFVYELCDADGDCDTAIVEITVNPVDDLPEAVKDDVSVNEDANVIIDVLLNDDFGGDGPDDNSIVITVNASHGVAVVDNNGTPFDPTDDQVIYTPDPDYNGLDTFVYRICDGDALCSVQVNNGPTDVDNDADGFSEEQGDCNDNNAAIRPGGLCGADCNVPDCDTAIVYITVDPVNDPPAVPDTLVTVPEDSAITVCVPITDVDQGDSWNVVVCAGPDNGILISGPQVSGVNVCLTYEPDPDWVGIDSICLVTCDTGGLCDTSLVEIVVTCVTRFTVADTVICEGQSVTVGINTYDTTGTYIDTLSAATSCDSIVTTNLTVIPRIHITIDTTICEGQSVTVGTNTYDTTGTYIDTLSAATSCDSIVTTNLTVIPRIRVTVDTTICEGQSVTVGINTYDTTGTYTDTLSAATSCDSIVTTNLTVIPRIHITVDTTICEGGSVTVGTNTYDTTGTYIDTLSAATSCDSIVTTNLTVIPRIHITIDTTICEGQSVTVGTNTYDTTGTYIDTLSAATSCDSIVTTNLTVIPRIHITIDTTICEGQSVTVGTNTYDTTGTYIDTLSSATSCDSIVTTNLTVIPRIHITVDTTICDGQSVTVGTNTYDTTGSYTDTLSAATSCDSIVTTNLTVIQRIRVTVDTTICEGQSVTVGTNTYDTTGTYIDTLSSATSCDSIVTTNLTVIPRIHITVDTTICEGQSVTVGTNMYDTTGTYIDTLSAATSCDSIVTTNLTVIPRIHITVDTTICDGQSVTVGTNTYDTTGSYTDTLSAATSCDSIVTTNLTVIQRIRVTVDTTICEGQSVTVGTNTYDSTGTYTDTLSAATTCDSIVTTNLTVIPRIHITVDTTICEGQSVTVGTNTYDTTGTYIDTLSAATSCDSIVTTNLTVIPRIHITVDTTICEGQSVTVGTNTYDTTGTYTDTLSAATTCDSIVTTNLTVIPRINITIDTTICEGQSVTVGTNTYDTTGTYTDTLSAATTCDSIVTTNLTVIPRIHITVDTTICEGQSVTVGTNTYDTTGSYTDTLSAATSCDSIVSTNLTVIPRIHITVDTTICEGQSVTVGTNTYDTTGTYTDTLSAATTCDSIVTTNLTVIPRIHITVDTTICEGQSVTVGTNTYDTTGSYTDTLSAATSCDSIVSTNLTVIPRIHITVDTTICEGQSVTVGTNTYDTTGTYIDTLSAATSCDSIVTTNLTVIPRIHITVDTTICEGQSVTVGTNTYDTTGTYTDTLSAATSCDSIVTTNLTVIPRIHITVDTTICEGQSVTVGTNTYDTTGTYIDTLSAATSCDSIVTTNLTVIPRIRVTVDTTICEGQSVTVGTNTYDSTGTYIDTLSAAMSCDSIVTTNLTVIQRIRVTVDTTICEGQSVTVGTNTYDTTGTYIDTLSAATSCDSIVTTNLTVIPRIHITVDTTICEGQSVTVGTNTYDTTGTYIDTLSAATSCDSIVTTNLTVIPRIHITVDTTICEGQSVTVGTNMYDTTGTYIDTLSAATSCDSIVTTNLTVIPRIHITIDTTICEGQSVTVGTNTYDTTGTYTDTLSAATSCDSIVTTNLSVIPRIHITVDTTICEGQSVTVGTNTYDTTGTYIDTLSAATSCDSIVTTNLTVIPRIHITVDTTICEGQSVTVGTNTYDSTGTYIDTLSAAMSCDSIVTTNLTVIPRIRVTVDTTICEGQSVTVGTNTYDSTGTYIDTLSAAMSCDSIVTTNLTVIPRIRVTVDTTICEGQSVTVGTNTYDTTGTYTDTLSAATSCDSIVTTNLTVIPRIRVTVDTTICEGQSVTVGTNMYDTTGTYIDTLSAATSCDSIVTTNITVIPTARVTQNLTICRGDQVIVGPNIYNVTGTYIDTLSTSNVCDSIVTTILNVNYCDTIITPVCDTCTEIACLGSITGISDGVWTLCDGTQQTTTGLGTVEIDSVGCITYVPNGIIGNDTLCIIVCDSVTNDCDTLTVVVRVSPTVDVIVDTGIVSTPKVVCIPVEPGMTADNTSIVNCGHVNNSGNTYSIDTNGCVTIIRSPTTGFNLDTLCVIICDQTLNVCDTTILVASNIPIQNIDTTVYDSLPVGRIDTICVTIPGGNNVEVASCSGSNNGSGNYGGWTLDTAGCLYYAAGTVKGTDTICIAACDTVLNTCITTTVIITVTGLPSVAVNDTTQTLPNIPVEIPVLVNDTSPDDDIVDLCDGLEIVVSPDNGTVVVNGNGTITYTPDINFAGADSFAYQVCDPEGKDTAWVFITVAGCIIPDAFTPNGDGIHDMFVIPCIGTNPASLAIYNRWGIEVYRNENYDNTFDGLYNGSPLPDGTYYYVLKYVNSEGKAIDQASFVVIHR